MVGHATYGGAVSLLYGALNPTSARYPIELAHATSLTEVEVMGILSVLTCEGMVRPFHEGYVTVPVSEDVDHFVATGEMPRKHKRRKTRKINHSRLL